MKGHVHFLNPSHSAGHKNRQFTFTAYLRGWHLSSLKHSFSFSLCLCLSFLSGNCTFLVQPSLFSTEVLPWLYLFLAFLGFLTNGLVMFELWRTQRKPTVIFTLNMVVSDIILCISFLFRIAYYRHSSHWEGNGPLCRMTLSVSISIFYVNIYCNMFFLLWMSINRYVTVVQSRLAVLQAFKNPQRSGQLCAATWLVFLVIIIGRVVGMQAYKTTETKACFHLMEHLKKELQVTMVLGTLLFFLILWAMLVSYGLLLYHLQKIRKTSLVSAGFGPGGGLRVKRKVLASVLVFLGCFLPHHILRSVLLISAQDDCATAEKFSQAKTATILVAALNCCLNPILHLVLRSPCCRAKRLNRSADETDCSRNQIPQLQITEAQEREVPPMWHLLMPQLATAIRGCEYPEVSSV